MGTKVTIFFLIKKYFYKLLHNIKRKVDIFEYRLYGKCSAEAGAFRPNLAILLPLLYVLFTDNNTHQNEILR